MVWYYIVGILLIIIASLVHFIMYQRTKYIEESLKDKKELSESLDKCQFYMKENIELKKNLEVLEEEKYKDIDTFNVSTGEIFLEPIYKGKKALIGDYLNFSYINTERVLRSLGFSVDIVSNGNDIIEKMKYGEHYDIIFSNNIYRYGPTGPECLKKLRELENFSTPIVIHTITKDKRDYFVNTIGFDDYIVKPVTQENVKPILHRLLDK